MLKLTDDSLNLDFFAKGYEDNEKCSLKLKTAYQKRITKLESLLSHKKLSEKTCQEYQTEIEILKDALQS